VAITQLGLKKKKKDKTVEKRGWKVKELNASRQERVHSNGRQITLAHFHDVSGTVYF